MGTRRFGSAMPSLGLACALLGCGDGHVDDPAGGSEDASTLDTTSSGASTGADGTEGDASDASTSGGADASSGSDSGEEVEDCGPQAWPAWRVAMTEPNTVYDVSDNVPRDVQFEFPGGVVPTAFSNPDDGNQATGNGVMGYGGGVHFRDTGRCGVLAFGSGGHDFAGNYVGALDLSADAAHYDAWQQPIYHDAPTDGAEFYWSPEEAAALPAARRFPVFGFDPEVWDGGFPLAIDGWVYPAPVRYVEMAEGVPTGQYRYDQHVYIPAELTGLGTGVWFIPSNVFAAPGFSHGIDWALCTDFWPSGGKKYYSHYQREDTKAWAHVDAPIPEGVSPGSFYPGHYGGAAGFSEKHAQVVVPAGGDLEVAIFDVSSGVANGTWSWHEVTRVGAWPTGWPNTKSAMSNGHPRDRAFYVLLGGEESLTIYDLDDPTLPLHVVSVPGLRASAGLHYIAARNEFVSFGIASGSAFYQRIVIPDDLADVASYTVEDVPLAAAPGVDVTTASTSAGQVQYVEELDCFVFLAWDAPAKAFWID